MDIYKLKLHPSKLNKLSQAKLKHTIQLCEAFLVSYEYQIRNYPPDRAKHCANYRQGWIDFIDLIKTKIEE